MTRKRQICNSLLGLGFLIMAGAAHAQTIPPPGIGIPLTEPGVGNALTEHYSGVPARLPGDQLDYLQSNFDKAAQELEAYLKQKPKSLQAHFLLAEIYSRQNKIALAILHLESAVSLDPEDMATQYRLGDAYLQTKQYEKAIHLYQAAQIRRPRDAKPVFQLGIALDREGKEAQAADAFDQSTQLDSKDSRTALYAGLLYHQIGDDAKAVPNLQKALTMKTPRKFEVYTALAEAATTTGNDQEALKNYQKAAQIRPDDFATVANLGVVSQNLGLTEAAAEFYRRALRMKNSDEKSQAQVKTNLQSLSPQ